jgi:hypothetical protein
MLSFRTVARHSSGSEKSTYQVSKQRVLNQSMTKQTHYRRYHRPGLHHVIGFAAHGETDKSLSAAHADYFYLCWLWFLIAPWLGLFDSQITSTPKQLWRPLLAMLLAAPMAAIQRAAMLNAVALPLFTLVLGGSAALGMLVWRGLYAFWVKNRNR